jgi:hypothetical protein
VTDAFSLFLRWQCGLLSTIKGALPGSFPLSGCLVEEGVLV